MMTQEKPCPLCGKPIGGEAVTELVEIEPSRFALCRLHTECSQRRKNGALTHAPDLTPDPKED